MKACFEELGQRIKDDEVKAMVAECNGPLNFPNFLDLFSAKLNGKDKPNSKIINLQSYKLWICLGTDPEEMLLNAFKLFDLQNTGNISKDE